MMKNNFFAAILLIALPVTSIFAQQNKSINVANPKQVISSFEKSSAQFIEQNKDLLVGFNEAELVKTLQDKKKSALAISEMVAGQKVKYIKQKMGLLTPVTTPKVNKALGVCDNLGFDQQDFTNWVGRLGSVNGGSWGACPDPIDSTLFNVGFALGPIDLTTNILNGNCGTATPERHVILTCYSCFDTNAINPNTGLPEIPYLAPGGGTTSVRLGNANTGGETERLTYKIDVTPFNSQLTYRYAVVYQNPSGHAFDEQPFFMVNVKDTLGQQIGGSCGAFCFFADPADTNFIVLPAGSQFSCDQSNDILYRKWTAVGVDLSPYIGQTLYLEFTSGDCALSGHWGYAYVDASCGVQSATISVCPNDTIGTLIAPTGYSSYQWQDALGVDILGATDDSLIVHNPQLGQHWTVRLESVAGAGCFTFLNVFISNYSNVPVQTTVLNLLCNGVTIGNATAIVDSTILHGPFFYQWYNNLGAIPGATSPVYNTNQAGTYWVKVINSGGCGNFVPDTAIVSSIPDFTMSPYPTQPLNLCLGQQATLNLNPTLSTGTSITINWEEFLTPNLDSLHTTPVVYTANNIGPDTVVYVVTSNYGCVKTDTVFVNVAGSYIADGTGIGSDTICVGDTLQIGVEFAPGSPEQCGATNLNCTLPVSVKQIGTDITTNSSNILNTAYPSPFGNLRLNAKQQYLYRASELQAAGMKGGLINSIGFNVKTLAPVTTYNNYTVRMHCSSLSAMTTDFDTAMVEVYHPKPFHAISGWNNIDFDQAYSWDGVSNLVIEICMDANTGGTQQNCAVEQSATSFSSSATISNFNAPVCNLISGATPSGKRPNTKFSICGIPADTSRYTYSWSPATGLSNATIVNPLANPATSIYYVVTITDTVNGCTDTASVFVKIPPRNVAITADTLEGGIPLLVNFTNNSNQNLVNYFWDYGDGTFINDTVFMNHDHTFLTAGEFTVKLIGTNSNGCTDTATVLIRGLLSELRVPNIFTPNGDGKNDEFKLEAPGIDTFNGIIFNRWGKKVYEWSDAAKGWDGKDAKDGVYFYVIKAKGVDGQDYSSNGHITLIR